MAGDDRVIHLLDRAILERALHDRVGELRLGDHHRPRGAHVEAVDDSLALGRPVAGDPIPGRLKVAQDSGSLPARPRVGGDADRLVDDDDVLIVVEDRHVGDGGRLALGLGNGDLDDVGGAQAIRLAGRHPVDQHESLPRQLRAARAREPKHAGQRRVDPLTHEGVGDG